MLALLGVMLGALWVIANVAWPMLIQVGLIVAIVGLFGGMIPGWVYHLRLYRVLRSNLVEGPPARWWLHPTAHHGAIEEGQRREVMRPFYAGAAGAGLSMVGAAIAAVGAIRSWL